jgi:hypothetical protein
MSTETNENKINKKDSNLSLHERLGLRRLSLEHEGVLYINLLEDYQGEIEVTNLKSITKNHSDIDAAFISGINNKDKEFGEKTQYLKNNVGNNDDSSLQIKVVGRVLDEKVLGKKALILLDERTIKIFNENLSRSVGHELINSNFGLIISTVDNGMPHVELDRFDVTSAAKHIVTKRFIDCDEGRIKVNNPNCEFKIMSAVSELTESKIKECMSIVRSELHNLKYQVYKCYFDELSEEEKNDERFINRIGIVYCSDVIKREIESYIPEDKNRRNRKRLNDRFYGQFGAQFRQSMKITFKCNVTRVLTSSTKSDSYDEIKIENGNYVHRDFICKEDISIPFNPDLLDQFTTRIYYLQIVMNICANAIAMANLGIDVDLDKVLNGLTFAKSDKGGKFNILGNDPEKVKMIEEFIHMTVKKAYDEISSETLVDLLENDVFQDFKGK